MIDPDRIRQVLSNYIGNALKFSRAERPITVRLGRLQIEGDTIGRARLAVHDEGIGVAADEVEHIWERFYRVSGVTHQSGSQVGLGLGLYISREIVERHGGQVGVHSAPGKGATFWCTLPLMRSAPHESKADA